jgi:hypothetical protein
MSYEVPVSSKYIWAGTVRTLDKDGKVLDTVKFDIDHCDKKLKISDNAISLMGTYWYVAVFIPYKKDSNEYNFLYYY